MPITVFVFGSNELGIHGAGAAEAAVRLHGAVHGVGRGRTGNAYAIPTKRKPTYEQRQIPLSEIQESISEFIEYAKSNPDIEFIVTRVGCGLAGYLDQEIAPMFGGAPSNAHLPEEWDKLS